MRSWLKKNNKGHYWEKWGNMNMGHILNTHCINVKFLWLITTMVNRIYC